MINKPFSQIGLDRSIPHIGVIMEKTDTSEYPRYELPPGFSFSRYRPGFENLWARLHFEVEQVDSLDEAETVFKREFIDGKGMDWSDKTIERLESVNIEASPCFKALNEKMIFVMDSNNDLAGTGSIWDGKHFGEVRQRLHWITVSPKYQNKGISKAIVSKLLDIYNDLGYSGYIYLTSQTWSYKALNVYAHFGFRPYMGDRPKNWRGLEPCNYTEKNAEAWNIINEKISEYYNCKGNDPW